MEFHNTESFNFYILFCCDTTWMFLLQGKELISQPLENSWYEVLYFCITTNWLTKNKLTHRLLTNCLWQSPTCGATQDILHSLWNSKVHYSIQNSLPLVPPLSQINPIHAISYYSLKTILILSPTHLTCFLPVTPSKPSIHLFPCNPPDHPNSIW